MTEPLTEKDVKKIAREEAFKVVAKEMLTIKEELQKQGGILARLERLLLGENGVNQDETLKWKANFAYQYARMNTESKIVEKADPALKWFQDMNTLEPGCRETKIESLGKLITFYMSIRWLLALIGITTLLNAIPIIGTSIRWLSQLVK